MKAKSFVENKVLFLFINRYQASLNSLLVGYSCSTLKILRGQKLRILSAVLPDIKFWSLQLVLSSSEQKTACVMWVKEARVT